MNTETVVKKLSGEIRKLSARDNMPERLKDRLKISEDLDFLLASGPVVYSLFNHVSFKYDYISPNVELMLGTEAEALMQMPYKEFLKCYMHPDDLQVIGTELFPDVVRYMQTDSGTKAGFPSVHYNYRMKTKAGDWIKVVQRTSPIKVNEEGKILLDQSFYMQKGHAENDKPHPMKLSIFCSGSNGLYDPEFTKTYIPGKKSIENLTDRELEVLHLLTKGKSSSEIGRALNIGETTVITHRRNMLKKFKLKNTNELISFAYKTGLL